MERPKDYADDEEWWDDEGLSRRELELAAEAMPLVICLLAVVAGIVIGGLLGW